jgi:hypothetical protein
MNMHTIPVNINHVYVIETNNMVENLGLPSLDEVVEFKNLDVQFKRLWHIIVTV